MNINYLGWIISDIKHKVMEYLLITCLTCLRALRAYAPYVPACLRASNSYVPTCLKLLRACVPTCLKLLRAYVPKYPDFSRAYVLTCVYILFMPTCLCALNYFVPSYAYFSRAYVPTTTHKVYWGSFLYLVVLLFYSELFGLSFHSKTQNKLLLLKLHIPILSCGFFLSRPLHTQKQ